MKKTVEVLLVNSISVRSGGLRKCLAFWFTLDCCLAWLVDKKNMFDFPTWFEFGRFGTRILAFEECQIETPPLSWFSLPNLTGLLNETWKDKDPGCLEWVPQLIKRLHHVLFLIDPSKFHWRSQIGFDLG
jgi:hypothetical protein